MVSYVWKEKFRMQKERERIKEIYRRILIAVLITLGNIAEAVGSVKNNIHNT